VLQVLRGAAMKPPDQRGRQTSTHKRNMRAIASAHSVALERNADFVTNSEERLAAGDTSHADCVPERIPLCSPWSRESGDMSARNATMPTAATQHVREQK